MNNKISKIYSLIQELSWFFGNQGFNGECCEDLSLIEFMALKKVYEKDNCTIQEIGKALNITKSGSSKIIDRLENKGYVRRVQSSSDGRVCCVEMTSTGADAILMIFDRYTDYVSSILKDFNPSSIDAIKNTLELLVTSVQKQGFIKSTISDDGDASC